MLAAIAAAKLRHGEVRKRIEQFEEMKEERRGRRGVELFALFYFYNFHMDAIPDYPRIPPIHYKIDGLLSRVIPISSARPNTPRYLLVHPLLHYLPPLCLFLLFLNDFLPRIFKFFFL